MDTVTDGIDAERFTHEPSVWKLTVLRLAGGLVSGPDPHLQWLVPKLLVGLLWHTGPELFIHGHSSSLIQSNTHVQEDRVKQAVVDI